MFGQWLVELSGSVQGLATLNLELINGVHMGRLIFLINPSDPSNGPSLITKVKIDINENRFKGKLNDFQPINPQTLLIDNWENVSEYFSGISIPQAGEITGTFTNDKIISGNWHTDVGTEGTFSAFVSDIERPSSYSSTIKSWVDFKKRISNISNSNFIFRGQRDQSKLSTSFHRTGRCDLFRYVEEDVPVLQRYLSCLPGHFYNLNNSLEYGAMLNLAQHHGYPTPLLDWTESPYVAAYFAYADVPKTQKDGNVRIFIFNQYDWSNVMPVYRYLTTPYLTFAPMNLLAIGNNRMLPQQSVTAFTNIVDIEGMIKVTENKHDKTYLEIADLPISDRETVMNELSQMGITAASLFPGLDGICSALKEKYF